MGLILDTSILIEVERSKIDFNLFKKYQEAYISVITMSELLVGVHRANTEERRLRRSAFVEYIIQALFILPFGEEEARIHAQIFSILLSKGLSVGSHDLLIAATAISHGYPLLTLNKKEFSHVPGLETLAPELVQF